jgi:hypothetical protein
MKKLLLAVLPLSLLLFSGCFELVQIATVGPTIREIFIVEGRTTKEEVIAQAGEPDAIHKYDTGEILDYTVKITRRFSVTYQRSDGSASHDVSDVLKVTIDSATNTVID